MNNLIKTVYLPLICLLLATGFAQTLQKVDGVAEFRPAENAPWQPAQVGDDFTVDSRLRTFQGEVTLALPEGELRLAPNSELYHPPRGFELKQGKAYVNADDVTFNMQGPVRIWGEARFDASDAAGKRAVLLSGEGRVTYLGSVVNLEPMQQLVMPEGGTPSFSSYFESDPWYQDLVSVGTGVARVIGFNGAADMQFSEEPSDDGWEVVYLEAAFNPIVFARTADDSWLEVKFDDGSVLRLQADTEIAVQQLEEFEDGTRRSLVKLRHGKIWAVVEGDGQPFEIETPGLVAGVRGTKLRVDAAEGDEPPLLKTFEGEVAAVIGYEVVEVAEGQQFDPEAGVADLELDALDTFNLERDEQVIAPELFVNAFPTQTPDATLTLQGETTGRLVQTGATVSELGGETFSLETPLNNGFNLVTVESRFTEDGAAAQHTQPVIRTEPAAFVALAEPVRQGNLVRLHGVALPGSTITLSGDDLERSATASENGRFSFNIITEENALVLDLIDLTGATTQQTVTINGP